MRCLILSHLPFLSMALHAPSPSPHLIPDSDADPESAEARLQAAYEKGGVQALAGAVVREVERETRGERERDMGGVEK
jgi:hypothetical protein